MKHLPENVVAYKRTPEFTENSISAGLLHQHSTKDSVWAKIVVLEGRLQYTINEPVHEVIILDEHTFGVVEPTVLHEVMPLGKVKFYVEFHK